MNFSAIGATANEILREGGYTFTAHSWAGREDVRIHFMDPKAKPHSILISDFRGMLPDEFRDRLRRELGNLGSS